MNLRILKPDLDVMFEDCAAFDTGRFGRFMRFPATLYFRCGIRKKKCVASGSGTLGESIESR